MSSSGYAAAVHAVHAAEALVRNVRQALAQAEEQLAQAQAQLQQTFPAQQQHWQLVPPVESVISQTSMKWKAFQIAMSKASSAQEMSIAHAFIYGVENSDQADHLSPRGLDALSAQLLVENASIMQGTAGLSMTEGSTDKPSETGSPTAAPITQCAWHEAQMCQPYHLTVQYMAVDARKRKESGLEVDGNQCSCDRLPRVIQEICENMARLLQHCPNFCDPTCAHADGMTCDPQMKNETTGPTTFVPTYSPTTKEPTKDPTTAIPTNAPTAPTHAPTQAPTNAPTNAPTQAPTIAPICYDLCSKMRSNKITQSHPRNLREYGKTAPASSEPSSAPSAQPSSEPSSAPSEQPSSEPSSAPTNEPTDSPTAVIPKHQFCHTAMKKHQYCNPE